jgi:hypothetical protein
MIHLVKKLGGFPYQLVPMKTCGMNLKVVKHKNTEM